MLLHGLLVTRESGGNYTELCEEMEKWKIWINFHIALMLMQVVGIILCQCLRPHHHYIILQLILNIYECTTISSLFHFWIWTILRTKRLNITSKWNQWSSQFFSPQAILWSRKDGDSNYIPLLSCIIIILFVIIWFVLLHLISSSCCFQQKFILHNYLIFYWLVI